MLSICYRRFLGVSAAAIGAIAIGYLLTVGQKQTIVIDKFSIAEDIKKTGYDEAGVARQLADEISTMTHSTTSTKDYRAAYSYDHEPLVQIKSSSLTVKSLAEILEKIRTKKCYLVSGALTHSGNENVRLIVRVDDHAVSSTSVPVAELHRGIQAVAEYVLSATEPYIYAAYLLTHGREEEALKGIQYCLINPPLEDDHWAYNLWGVYFLERQKYD